MLSIVGRGGPSVWGNSRAWGGPICLQSYLSWRRVWEDLRVGVPMLKGSPDVMFGIPLDLGGKGSGPMEVGKRAGGCPIYL